MTKSSEPLQDITAKFATQQAAQEAYQAIQAAGFPAERISLTSHNTDYNPKLNQTQAGRSAKGGAIAGAVLGALVAFTLSLAASSFPGVGPTVYGGNIGSFNFIIAIAGAIVGAAGFGLMGALSGINVPKEETQSDRESLTTDYLIVVRGTKEELSTATEILYQQGGRI